MTPNERAGPRRLWRAFYATKIYQQMQRGLRCPGCGRRNPSESHHLFVRRPDGPWLQEDWNIIQICTRCHQEERRETQVRAALEKLWKYGPDGIEALVASIPGRSERRLPGFYAQAVSLYRKGKRPFKDY